MNAIRTALTNERIIQSAVRAVKTFIVVFLAAILTSPIVPQDWAALWPLVQQAGLAALGMASWKAVNGSTVKV